MNRGKENMSLDQEKTALAIVTCSTDYQEAKIKPSSLWQF